MGLFEEFDAYAQKDLDLFFENFAPNVPQGTSPQVRILSPLHVVRRNWLAGLYNSIESVDRFGDATLKTFHLDALANVPSNPS